MGTLIHRPDGRLADGAVQLASATPVLSGGRIGVLDNGKPNAGLLLSQVADGLAERIGGNVVTTTGKGARANAATACSPQVLETLTKEVELVLTGSAD
jgi:X-X-X-Leu-X-X-Gly heptad repeat protein